MRIGTKSLLCCRSSRLVSGIHPLSSGSSPSPSRLWTRLLRHPAFPLVHQLLLVRTSWYLLMIFYVFLGLLCRSHGAKHPEIYKTSTICFSSLMQGLGRHIWGESSSLSWGKETNLPPRVKSGQFGTNSSKRTIWHQEFKTDNVASRVKSRQFGTGTIWHQCLCALLATGIKMSLCWTF